MIGLFAVGRMLLDGLRHDLSSVGLAAERGLACALLLVSVVGLWMWLMKPQEDADSGSESDAETRDPRPETRDPRPETRDPSADSEPVSR